LQEQGVNRRTEVGGAESVDKVELELVVEVMEVEVNVAGPVLIGMGVVTGFVE
jgi:hypothetical protein